MQNLQAGMKALLSIKITVCKGFLKSSFKHLFYKISTLVVTLTLGLLQRQIHLTQ